MRNQTKRFSKLFVVRDYDWNFDLLHFTKYTNFKNNDQIINYKIHDVRRRYYNNIEKSKKNQRFNWDFRTVWKNIENKNELT